MSSVCSRPFFNPAVNRQVGNDSTHVTNVFHYVDRAIDLRANDITDAQSSRIETRLKDALGSDCRLEFEHFLGNVENDHINIAYRGS